MILHTLELPFIIIISITGEDDKKFKSSVAVRVLGYLGTEVINVGQA